MDEVATRRIKAAMREEFRALGIDPSPAFLDQEFKAFMDESGRHADRITVFKDKAGEWRWTKVAPNGEPVAQSEGYTTKDSAVEAAFREADDRADVVVEGA